MTNDIVPATADTHPGVSAEVLEQVVVLGNLEKLTASQRLEYYNSVCRSLGLNPLTRPFEYIELNGRLTLYARRDATDQLRSSRHVAVEIPSREKVDDIYVVTARGTMPDGRTDESIGAVPLSKEDGEWKTAQNGRRYFAGNGKWVPLQGDERANALMKAETKAKRRVTLSICGLGFLDETEIETVTTATQVSVDAATGEILAPPVPDTTSAPKVPPASTTRATPPPVTRVTDEQIAEIKGHAAGWPGGLQQLFATHAPEVLSTTGGWRREKLTWLKAEELLAKLAGEKLGGEEDDGDATDQALSHFA